MTPDQYQALLHTLIPVAQEAGDLIMQIYNESSDIEVTSKADDSPLTLADRTANAHICAALEQIDPKFPIVSEENKQIPYEERKDYSHFWLVDPLDGTKEFIKRNGEFTVNIALVHDGKVVLGVVHAPALNQTYYAAKGLGAFRQNGTEPFALKTPVFATSDPNLGVVCSRSHLNDETQAFVDQLNQPNLVPKGSSLKFLILAEGDAHIYPRLAPTMEWDTAAAQIILEEAGGQVLNWETKRPLEYNKEILRNPKFVAYGNKK